MELIRIIFVYVNMRPVVVVLKTVGDPLNRTDSENTELYDIN